MDGRSRSVADFELACVEDRTPLRSSDTSDHGEIGGMDGHRLLDGRVIILVHDCTDTLPCTLLPRALGSCHVQVGSVSLSPCPSCEPREKEPLTVAFAAA